MSVVRFKFTFGSISLAREAVRITTVSARDLEEARSMLPSIRRWIPQIGKEESTTLKPGYRDKYYASDQNLEATEALEPFGLTIAELGALYLETFRSLSRRPTTVSDEPVEAAAGGAE